MDLLLSAWTLQGSREREHARGFMGTSTPIEPPVAMDLEAIFKRLPMLDSHGVSITEVDHVRLMHRNPQGSINHCSRWHSMDPTFSEL